MDIGTAKPSSPELSEIPHHLIDIRDPGDSFTAGDFRWSSTLSNLEREGNARSSSEARVSISKPCFTDCGKALRDSGSSVPSPAGQAAPVA